MTEPLARVAVEVSDGVARVAVAGEIDLSNAHDLTTRIAEATADAKRVVVELSQITYLDSSGIRLLLFLARRRAGRLTVVAPGDSVAGGVLRMTQVEEIDVVDSAD